MKFLTKIFTALIFTFALIHHTKAQAQKEPVDSVKTIPLEELVVQGTRSEKKLADHPASIHVIPEIQIQRGQATISLEESLRSVPGVFVNNRFNFSQGDRISIRGIGTRSAFGVRGIKIILDDIPLTMPDGQTQINNIDLSSLGSAEIIKGPSGVLYGNSSGGVIYLTSQNPSADKLTIAPSFIAGSFGMQKIQLKTSGSLHKFSYLLNMNKTDYSGYRAFSASRFYNINSVVKYSVRAGQNISVVMNYNNAPYLLNPGSLDKKTADESPKSSRKFNQLQGAGKTLDQLQGGISYKGLLGNNQKISVTAFGVGRNLYNPIPGRIIDLKRSAFGLRGSYNKNVQLGNVLADIHMGIDWENQKDQRKEFENLGIEESFFNTLTVDKVVRSAEKGSTLVSQKESIQGTGLFTKLDLSIKKWIFTLGARYDNYLFKVDDHLLTDNSDDSGKKNLDQINPSIGLIFKYSRQINIYLNYSSSFQTPSANEFGNLPTGKGGFNQQLEPENIRSFEAGFRGSFLDDKLTYDFAAFFMNIGNQLIPYQTADTTVDEVYYRNAGRTRNAGFEIFLSYKSFDFLSFQGSYAANNYLFLDYAIESGNDIYQLKKNQVPGLPARRGFIGIKYTPVKGLTSELNFQQTDSYFANDFNGPVTSGSANKRDFINEGFTQLDFRLSYERQIGRSKPLIFGGINNILNQTYNSSVVVNAAGNRFFEPAPGINFYAGITLPLSVIK